MREILASLDSVIQELENTGFIAEAYTLESEAFLRVAEETEDKAKAENDLREETNAIHPGEPKTKK